MLLIPLLALETAWKSAATQAGVQSEKTRLAIRGEALSTALPKIGSQFGASLIPSRELSEQRLTAFGKDVSLETWKRGIEELLSAGPDAGVRWVRSGSSSRLEESVNRRKLRIRLRDHDQEFFRRYVESEMAWAKEAGLKELAADPSAASGSKTRQRLLMAWIMSELGAGGRERLIQGEPAVVPLGSLAGGPRWPVVVDYFTWHLGGHNGPPGAEELLRYQLVLFRERHSTARDGGGVVVSYVLPDGFVPVSGSYLRPPLGLENPQGLDFGLRKINLVSGTTNPAERRVSLKLALVVPKARSGKVERGFDELLEAVAVASGITIVADGYLRVPQEVPPEWNVKDVAVESLLDLIANAWNCDWHYLGNDGKARGDRNTVLFRARRWWLEDEADVPQQTVDKVRLELGNTALPSLERLLPLMELKEAQIRKLTDLGVCNTKGLLEGGMGHGHGVRPVLRFYARLSQAQRERVLSKSGLPLSEANLQLVETFLRPTLMGVGAITRQARQLLTFRLEPLDRRTPSQTQQVRGYTVLISDPQKRTGSRLLRYFYVSAPVEPPAPDVKPTRNQ